MTFATPAIRDCQRPPDQMEVESGVLCLWNNGQPPATPVPVQDSDIETELAVAVRGRENSPHPMVSPTLVPSPTLLESEVSASARASPGCPVPAQPASVPGCGYGAVKCDVDFCPILQVARNTTKQGPQPPPPLHVGSKRLWAAQPAHDRILLPVA